MSTAYADVEKLVFTLPDNQRARLVESLLRSLPSPGWDDDDDGIEEAMRRSRELEEHPEMAISHDEFVKFFEDRWKK